MKYQLLKAGTDCELFLKNQQGNPVPAIGLIGGTKEHPRPILGGNGFAVQEDNVMVEFNIPAVEDLQGFVKNISAVLEYLSEYAKERNLILDYSASLAFDPKSLEHPQAKEIGCMPDYCVWTGEMNEIKSNEVLQWLRTSGGHLHMTYTVDDASPLPRHIGRFVRMNDLVLGIPSVLMDKDTRRKLAYGKAGAFRPKVYGNDEGHEYRVLSNFWIQTKRLQEWAFEGINRCVEELNKGMIEFNEGLAKTIQQTINSNNTESALNIVKRFNLEAIY